MSTVTPNQPIHPKFDDRISVKIQGQLPNFIKQDHKTFISFMEAYYEYMEQEGKPYEIIGNLDHYANIDKTVNDFLQYFKKQFGEDIPEAVFQNANKPFVLKHLRDFYRTKGSTKSFEFLFRLLYKEEITLDFPGQNILRTSDGKYDDNKVIKIIDSTITGNSSKLIGKSITGVTSGAEAIVENIITEIIGRYSVTTLSLSNVFGTFQAEENITDGTYFFEIGSVIIDTNITNAGSQYSVGDAIPIVGGGLGSGGFIRVSEVNTGWFNSVTINNGGTGYKNNDILTVNNGDKLVIDGRSASVFVKEVDINGVILDVEIENNGSGYTGLPTISGGSGNGADITFVIDDTTIGGIKSLEIINPGFGYKPVPTLDFSNHGDGKATANIIIGGYNPTPGLNFVNNDGFLNSDKFIQDSYYYQLFSYEITSSRNIKEWNDIVKRVAHPAGLALFGRYQLLSHLEIPLSLTSIVPDTEDRYIIIFHDGSIEPPFILDLTIETCDDEQDIRDIREGDDYGGFDLSDLLEDYQPEPETLETNHALTADDEDYQPEPETLSTSSSSEETNGTLWEPAASVRPADIGCPGDVDFPFEIGICSPTDFGSITDNDTMSGVQDLHPEDYDLVTKENFIILPTKCQIYEKDLLVQKLQRLGGFEDYLFTDLLAGEVSGSSRPPLEDEGSVTEAETSTEDYGWVFQNPISFTQLRLGPLKRTIERQKFNTQGGFSQSVNTVNGIDRIGVFEQGSGYTVVPNVTISAPASGTTATATAVLGTGADSGKVVSITLNDIGSGYTTVPTITIDAPTTGTTATATAIFQRTAHSPIRNFSDKKITEYLFFAGLKTKLSTNTMITQYTTGFEHRGTVGVPPSVGVNPNVNNVALPFTPV